MACCYYLLRYLREATTRLLVISGGFCFFAFLSRATTGAGAVLAFLLLGAGLLAQELQGTG